MNRLAYSLSMIMLLSGCKQLKSLTSKDISASKVVAKPKTHKNVRFLEDISVTPGQVVTSGHATPGSDISKNKQGSSSMLYSQTVVNMPVTAEQKNLLQFKYSMMLDASPDKITNTNLLGLIDEWWGTKYCMGGSTKDCIDCSAFSQLVMSSIYQLNLPRTAQKQFDMCGKVPVEELQEGDLVFFSTQGRSITHVGVYIMNNKFVHASTSQGVVINDLNDSYWKSKFSSAGRIK